SPWRGNPGYDRGRTAIEAPAHDPQALSPEITEMDDQKDSSPSARTHAALCSINGSTGITRRATDSTRPAPIDWLTCQAATCCRLPHKSQSGLACVSNMH